MKFFSYWIWAMCMAELAILEKVVFGPDLAYKCFITSALFFLAAAYGRYHKDKELARDKKNLKNPF